MLQLGSMNAESEQSVSQPPSGADAVVSVPVGARQPVASPGEKPKRLFARLWPPLTLAGLLVVIGLLAWQHDLASDWLVSRGYHPTAAMQALAHDDTMTAYARRLFYVNKPQIEESAAFNKHCANTYDQVTVLGCFVGNRQGIYVYDITDSRLEGIQQVTAAHEMLHQAYERLNVADRKRVDNLLTSYAKTVTDPDLQEKIATYRKTEPHDVVNEMHSVFGTEVSDLPPALEQYYRRYFTDRHNITRLHAQYQQAFTERTEQIASYDAQIAELKQQIDTSKTTVDTQEKALEAQRAQLDALAASDEVSAYNAAVPGFNSRVNAQKALISQTNTLIGQYNELIDARNAIAVQKRQLQQAINSHASATTEH